MTNKGMIIIEATFVLPIIGLMTGILILTSVYLTHSFTLQRAVQQTTNELVGMIENPEITYDKQLDPDKLKRYSPYAGTTLTKSSTEKKAEEILERLGVPPDSYELDVKLAYTDELEELGIIDRVEVNLKKTIKYPINLKFMGLDKDEFVIDITTIGKPHQQTEYIHLYDFGVQLTLGIRDSIENAIQSTIESIIEWFIESIAWRETEESDR